MLAVVLLEGYFLAVAFRERAFSILFPVDVVDAIGFFVIALCKIVYKCKLNSKFV